MEYPKYFKSIDELEDMEKSNQSNNSGNFYNDLEKVRKYRFYVKPGEQAKCVFLDNFKFGIWEHQFKVGNDFYNYDTCLRDIEGECPLCESGNKPYVIIVSSVLSLWKTDKGEFKVTKKLICAKGDAKDILLRRQQDLGDLRGKVFKFYRSNNKKSNSLGTDIQYEKEIDLNSLKQYCPKEVEFEDWTNPFDYAEIFKPKSVSELRKVLGQEIGVGEGDDNESDIENVDKEIENLI